MGRLCRPELFFVVSLWKLVRRRMLETRLGRRVGLGWVVVGSALSRLESQSGRQQHQHHYQHNHPRLLAVVGVVVEVVALRSCSTLKVHGLVLPPFLFQIPYFIWIGFTVLPFFFLK